MAKQRCVGWGLAWPAPAGHPISLGGGLCLLWGFLGMTLVASALWAHGMAGVGVTEVGHFPFPTLRCQPWARGGDKAERLTCSGVAPWGNRGGQPVPEGSHSTKTRIDKTSFFQTLLSAAELGSHTPAHDPVSGWGGGCQGAHPLPLYHRCERAGPPHLPLFFTLSLSFLICKASQG